MADHGFIMTEPALWVGATAAYPFSPELVKKYTVTDRFGELHKLWDSDGSGQRIFLPRAFCPPPSPETDKRAWQHRAPLPTTIQPRDDEQAQAMAKATKLVLDGRSFCINAQTGSGKTVVGIKVAADVGVQTMIVVPKDDLYTQWQKELVKFGIPASKIGCVRADTFNVAGKQIVVAMLHSISKPGRYPGWFYTWAGFTLVDEVHRIGADTFMECVRLFNSKVRVGLSATHARADGMDVAIRGHIGPILVNMDIEQMVPKVLVRRTEWLVPRWRRKDPVTGVSTMIKAPHSPGKAMHIFVKMCQDMPRNLLIAEGIKAAYDKGRKIVAFTELLDHIDTMAGILRGQGIPASEITTWVGGMSKEARSEARKGRVILATWGSMAEGTDIPELDTAVFMTPRSNVKQPTGRVRRLCEDDEGNSLKKFPVVMDYVDADSPVFKAYADKRRAFYASIGCEIVILD